LTRTNGTKTKSDFWKTGIPFFISPAEHFEKKGRGRQHPCDNYRSHYRISFLFRNLPDKVGITQCGKKGKRRFPEIDFSSGRIEIALRMRLR
jgi:hypothetical protein